LTTRRRWRRVGTVTFLVAVLAIVAVAAFGGTAAAQSAPDCSTVTYNQNADGAYLVTNADQLQCVANTSTATDRDDDYVVTQDIDASDTSNWNGVLGFEPIANGTTFVGTFDGGGHTISGLFINRAGSYDVGLFGVVGADGEVTDTNLVGVDVTGDGDTGSLVGENEGTVGNSTAAGDVSGVGIEVGGLVGRNDGSVTGSEANVAVTGSDDVGGLVGENQGSVSQSLADGGVTGGTDTGGLVGRNRGTISESLATGNVEVDGSGNPEIAGLAGENEGSISRSRATGDVTAPDRNEVGGLVGTNEGSIVESSASGAARCGGVNTSSRLPPS
jgi:hypothetical protein